MQPLWNLTGGVSYIRAIPFLRFFRRTEVFFPQPNWMKSTKTQFCYNAQNIIAAICFPKRWDKFDGFISYHLINSVSITAFIDHEYNWYANLSKMHFDRVYQILMFPINHFSHSAFFFSCLVSVRSLFHYVCLRKCSYVLQQLQINKNFDIYFFYQFTWHLFWDAGQITILLDFGWLFLVTQY